MGKYIEVYIDDDELIDDEELREVIDSINLYIKTVRYRLSMGYDEKVTIEQHFKRIEAIIKDR